MTDWEPEPTTVEQCLSDSNALVEWLKRNAYDLKPRDEDKCQLAAKCFRVALQHHRAIVFLTAHGYWTSAFPLVRIFYEALTTGEWIHSQATPDDLDSLKQTGKTKKGKSDLNLWEMVKALEKNGEHDGGARSMLSRSKAKPAMDDYVHTNWLQLNRHDVAETSEPTFTETEIVRMLKWVNALGLWTALCMHSVSDKTIDWHEYIQQMADYLHFVDSIFKLPFQADLPHRP